VTELDAANALLARFIVQWPVKVGGTQAAAAVPYAIDNRKLVQPVPPFASVEIVNLDGDQATMGVVGNRKYLRMGFFDVKIYDARDQGRGRADRLASYVRDIYESTTIGAVGELERGILTYTTSIKPVKDAEFPDLWCVRARTPFEFYERR
jgi:hypothetical protein